MYIPRSVDSYSRFVVFLLVASCYKATAEKGGESVSAPFTNDPVELPAMVGEAVVAGSGCIGLLFGSVPIFVPIQHHAPTHYEAESYTYWYENKPMPHRHGDLHNPMERHQHFPKYNENEEKLFSNFVTGAC